MGTYWREKINRLDEFEQFFKNYLNDKIIKSIQYISLRKQTYKGYLILVGITDISFKEKILTYAPRILKEIREYQEKKGTDDHYEKLRIPTKLDIFEFNLEKKKKKDEQRKEEQKKIEEWYLNPQKFLEKTNLPNQYIPNKEKIIFNGLIISINHSKTMSKDTSIKCRIFMGDFDFEKTYKTGLTYRFLKDHAKYYKFRNTYKDTLEIRPTNKIGTCIIVGNDCSALKEITKKTYLRNIN